MIPETAYETLMTYNAMSGILFALCLAIISICILRNQDNDENCNDYDEFEDHDEYNGDWW